MLARWKPHLIGMLTYTPLAGRYTTPKTGGTDNARYCYGVFMRHLCYAHRAGMTKVPEVVAELGPGDSLGTGLAWLIAGSARYLAFDVRRYATTARNLQVFDALVDLFRARADVPGSDEFPEMKPALDTLAFPHEMLPTAHLDRSLDAARLVRIRLALQDTEAGSSGPIAYVAPWDDATNVREKSVDLIFSQAVMEHVEDVDHTYAMCKRWLKPEGMISHQIDFRSHGSSPTWDGYRAYSELEWRIVRGRRSYLINRISDAGHIDAMKRIGLRAVTRIPSTLAPTVRPGQYAQRFRDLSPESRQTAGLFVQAVPD
jgi:SAM-dependent methyltransferase